MGTHRTYPFSSPQPARTVERNQRTCVIPPTSDYHDNKDDEATLLSAPPTSSSNGRLLLVADDIEPPGYVYRLFTSS